MALVVHSLGAYASYPDSRIPWRRSDYDINKLVKSLKGEPLKGYANLRDVDRVMRRIVPDDRDPALQYFAAWAARRLATLNIGRFVLVPVPSSSSISYNSRGAPFDMACAIQQRMGRGVKVERWLRFAEKMIPSHDGGSRDVRVLAASMKVAAACEHGIRVVLVDDVKTTGSHCKASAQRLRACDMNVETVVVAATTVWEQQRNPFLMDPEDLEGERTDSF